MKRRHLLMALLALTPLFAPHFANADDKAAKTDEKAAKTEKADKTEKVRLYVEGAYCAGCASVLVSALDEGGLKNGSKLPANFGKGPVIISGDYRHDADLSKVAKAVNAAETPHRKQSKPGLAIEVFAKLDEKSAKAAIATLETVEGVDAKGSVADTGRGAIAVRLTGEGKVTVNELLASLKKAGIEGKIGTDTVIKPNPPSEDGPKKKKY